MAKLCTDVRNGMAFRQVQRCKGVAEIIHGMRSDGGPFRNLSENLTRPVFVDRVSDPVEEYPLWHFAKPSALGLTSSNAVQPFEYRCQFSTHVDVSKPSGFGWPDLSARESTFDQDFATFEIYILPAQS
jgi:hypothetical protein